jgi:hypothetical protein
MVDGIAQRPIEGVSMAYTFDQKNANAPSTHTTRSMQELFLVEAAKYNVFPLDNSILERALTPRPSPTAVLRDVWQPRHLPRRLDCCHNARKSLSSQRRSRPKL